MKRSRIVALERDQVWKQNCILGTSFVIPAMERFCAGLLVC